MPHSSIKSLPRFKYIFGPVYSWRLGQSLGVDPLSAKAKICSYGCIYCQLGRTRNLSRRRQVFVPVREITREIRSLPPVKIDYITFSGRGEPTLAKNLGRMIRAVRRIRPEKIAVITNGSLLDRKGVREDLGSADFVLVKLDAWDASSWRKINQPASGIGFERMLSGIKRFRKEYQGRFGLQIMLMNLSRQGVDRLADLARQIRPDEIQLNTPLRENPISPLSRAAMDQLTRTFKGMRIRMVYQAERRKSKPLNQQTTRRRHGTERL